MKGKANGFARAVVFTLAALFTLGVAVPSLADEPTRRAQEELRKRNLYFGDIDGRVTAELSAAVRRYQLRKGFESSGTLDEETCNSLNIPWSGERGGSPTRLPDVPILRSDAAREIPEAERVALEQQFDENPDSGMDAPAPAESPSEQGLTPQQVTQLVENYLRDAESDDVAAQVGYYAFPVTYFDHGAVKEDFVTRDTRNYVKRWPERKYVLMEPVSFTAGARAGETTVQFTIAFNVRNSKQQASGKTKNYWTVKPIGDDLKITAIREERLRE